VFGPALFSSGPAALYLGMLAGVTRSHDRAVRHFTEATAMSRRMGWLPLLARCQYEHACVLVARGCAPDLVVARDLLDEAGAAASTLGLERLARAVAARRTNLR
jgi:hypothetical protein